MPRLAISKQPQQIDDIYSVIDLSQFKFTIRENPFDWRLLHGIDVDQVVRLNDTPTLERVIPTLLSGSSNAEPSLSQQNYLQLFRLVQLAVEHLWQMRESHARLYPAYVVAESAATSWAAAASRYLELAGQLLCQLQASNGALLMQQSLERVAAARAELESADSAYNTALDKLEAEDVAARSQKLRRQRLDISWRQVFGVDVQQLVASGDVKQLETLLPQVAYGNVMSEDPTTLTTRHFTQLLSLGQTCLDYLWAICLATSRVMEQQVQQLAADSKHLPELTTETERVRKALAAALTGDGLQMQFEETSSICRQPRSPSKVHWHASGAPPQTFSRPCTAAACRTSTAAVNIPGHCCRWVGHQEPVSCCHDGAMLRSAATTRNHSCSNDYLLSSLSPAAGLLRTKMDQLDWDIRVERERTEAMRMTLIDATSRLEQLLTASSNGQQQGQQQPHLSVSLPQQTVPDNSVHLHVQSQSQGGSRAETPASGVRVVIDEDTIRAQERQAAGQMLSQHIHDVVLHHDFVRKLRSGSGQRTSVSPRVTIRSVSPSAVADEPRAMFERPFNFQDGPSAAYGEHQAQKRAEAGPASKTTTREGNGVSSKHILVPNSNDGARANAKQVGEMVAAAARIAAAAGTHGLGKSNKEATAAAAEQQEGGGDPKRVSHLSGWRLLGLGSSLPKRKSSVKDSSSSSTATQPDVRSGSSFTSVSVAKAAADVTAVVPPMGRPLTPTEAVAMSPLRASIVASSTGDAGQ